MASNFSFLEQHQQFISFAQACAEAEKSIAISPSTTAILSRRALELAVKWLYASDSELKVPYQDNLSSLIHERSFIDLIDQSLFAPIKYIIKLGNIAAHSPVPVKRPEAVLSLYNLHQFTSWISYCYAPAYCETPFDESLLPTGTEQKVSQGELEKLYGTLGEKDGKLKDVVQENEALRRELRQLREANVRSRFYVPAEICEYATRKKYIDLDLKDAGWTFGNDCIEEVEVAGMPYGTGQGFADYVLWGENGRPLAVVEAKRTTVDPLVGQQQAKLYADCLEKKYKQRPVIFYTNGFNTHLWDDLHYPPRRTSGFYSREELQLLVDRRIHRTSLKNAPINNDVTNRYYQKEAIRATCEAYEGKARKALLVMATGSGKTRTVISLVDMLSKHGWVKNVLFLADRTALVRQAKNNFNTLLPNMSLCNLLDGQDNPESRIVFSTYPTMMNAIDETKAKDGRKLFTIGHFDLVIIDESHRSIYKKYKAIFDYFDSLLIGLTATPKDDIDKNTYHIFDLENNVPTYAYELKQAVSDHFLVPYRSVETQLKFMEEGIRYDDLTDEEKEQYEETFDDDMPDFISSDALNQWLFNDDTIDKVLLQVMEKGIKIQGGDKLGKTVVFAKNHKHAERIAVRFDALYPACHGEFARIIDNQVKYAQDLIDKFATKERLPQIAISVDMLDTGIDVPEIVNLILFKKIRSKSKFWQMIGRGTRLCPDLFGPGADKECFYVFDFCGNFEFFRANPQGVEVKENRSLTERLFGLKLDLIRELQHLDYQQDEYPAFRHRLVTECHADIKALNRENFAVRQHLEQVDLFLIREAWTVLTIINIKELKEHIGPLLDSTDPDEMAKRFDQLMFCLELATLLHLSVNKARENVVKTGRTLAKLGTIPQVQAKRDIIERIQTDAFWEQATVLDYEEVRLALRDLIKFISGDTTKIYFTNFTDSILSIEENEAEYAPTTLASYYKKVNQYLREHQERLVIYKLRHNKPLTRQDYVELEHILWGEVGTKADYMKEFGDTPLTLLVRQIIGLDMETANEAFSEFLNNQNLDSRQIRFIRLIVEYVVRHGHMTDKSVLREDPFKSIGSITELFPLEDQMKVVGIIDGINRNALEVVGA